MLKCQISNPGLVVQQEESGSMNWSSPPLGHPFLRQMWPKRPLKA